jgi:Ca-activated chloride channel homolog
MQFLAPAAFALLALLPIIVALYLLKLRRDEQPVSSIYLWQRMTRDLQANAPWQRLRRSLLLLLQLLFLLALILTLTRPFSLGTGSASQSLTLIIDTSASMGAIDVEPNRLTAARQQARQIVESLPDKARVTVIRAAESAEVMIASSQDRRRVLSAIDTLEINAASSNLTSALELASALAARQPDSETIIISDGRTELPERLAFKGRITYLPIGISGENQAISALNIQAGPGGQGWTAFVQITNFGETIISRRLTFYAGEKLFSAHDLELPSGEPIGLVIENLPQEIDTVEARLTGEDALPLDDHAWAAVGRSEPAAVTLITDGNLFLETALTLLPGISLMVQSPDQVESSQGLEADPDLASTLSSDLTILDAVIPGGSLPQGNLLIIAPPSGTELFDIAGVVDLPVPRAADIDDPIMANVPLAGVHISQAAQIPTPPWARILINGDSAEGSIPLLFSGLADGRRVAVLTFDLHQSDLPLQPAFPILIANLIQWLVPAGGLALPEDVQLGQNVSIALPPEISRVEIISPSGLISTGTIEDRSLRFSDTTQVGIYSLLINGEQAGAFAVNLISPAESDIRPAPTLVITASSGTEQTGQSEARLEWWRNLALLALGLLMIEWLVYQRSALSRWGSVLAGWIPRGLRKRSVEE